MTKDKCKCKYFFRNTNYHYHYHAPNFTLPAKGAIWGTTPPTHFELGGAIWGITNNVGQSTYLPLAAGVPYGVMWDHCAVRRSRYPAALRTFPRPLGALLGAPNGTCGLGRRVKRPV